MNGKDIVNELIKEKIDSLEKEQKILIHIRDEAYERQMSAGDKAFEIEKQIRELKGQIK